MLTGRLTRSQEHHTFDKLNPPEETVEGMIPNRAELTLKDSAAVLETDCDTTGAVDGAAVGRGVKKVFVCTPTSRIFTVASMPTSAYCGQLAPWQCVQCPGPEESGSGDDDVGAGGEHGEGGSQLTITDAADSHCSSSVCAINCS